MKKRFVSFLVLAAVLLFGLIGSTPASAASYKNTYYSTKGAHLYKDKKGVKVIRTLPSGSKFYLTHKPTKGYYFVTYGKTSGYINVKDFSKSRYATFKDFKGSWFLDKKSKHSQYEISITKNHIYYNYYPNALIGAVKLNQAVIRDNTLILKNVTLRGDGTQVWGKLTQTLKLTESNGKKILVVSKPSNKEISNFHGTALKK